VHAAAVTNCHGCCCQLWQLNQPTVAIADTDCGIWSRKMSDVRSLWALIWSVEKVFCHQASCLLVLKQEMKM